MSETKTVTAAVLLIGDEILSGRTQDKNLAHIAKWLGERGIRVREARVIPDVEETIVATLNEMRAAHDYVFTTGGIGPTHDDITADCVAKAFGVPISHHPDAMALLAAHYEASGFEFNEARQRMARIPEGAELIDNPVSKAPGFHIGNVFVMAGVPMVMQVMLESLADKLVGGEKLLSRTVSGQMAEGQLAEPLGKLQAKYPDISMGSYPFYRGGSFGVSLVLRGTDEARLEAALADAVAMVKDLGVEPIFSEAV